EQALATPPEDPARCDLALQAQRLFMEDYQGMLFGAENNSLNALAHVKNYNRGPDRTFIEPWRLYIGQE
ncbi:MAG: hypothetical protein M3440_11455, partial [Chloroflexota bacterium]|nr:hypothetical protein [Chloroflexota bacterium]